MPNGNEISYKTLAIILTGFVLISAIMLSFSPIVIFFLITSKNYDFLKLLHVAIIGFAGIFGMRTVVEALKFSCEKKNVYPKIGVKIFQFWIFSWPLSGCSLPGAFVLSSELKINLINCLESKRKKYLPRRSGKSGVLKNPSSMSGLSSTSMKNLAK